VTLTHSCFKAGYFFADFQTDAEISGSHDHAGADKEREFVRWVPDGPEDEFVISHFLFLQIVSFFSTTSDGLLKQADALDRQGAVMEWDQFRVNEAKFGQKSSYNEELYTTRLDISQIDPAQLARADAITRSILKVCLAR